MFAALTRQAREARGWTQEALRRHLADEQGVVLEKTAMIRLEGGKRPIRLNEAVALARVFGLDLSPLLRPAQPPTPEEIQAARAAREEARRALDAKRSDIQVVEAQYGAADAAWRTIAARLAWFGEVGAEAHAFDSADPADLKTGTGTATLPDGGEVKVRALTRDEVMHVKALRDVLDKEIYIVATGMTSPELSEEDVTRWADKAPSGDMGAVLRAIAELSGVMGGGL